MHHHSGFHHGASRGDILLQRFVIAVVTEIADVEARSCRLDHFTNAAGTLLSRLTAALGLLLFLRRIDQTKRDRFDEFLPTGRLRLGTATASISTTTVSTTTVSATISTATAIAAPVFATIASTVSTAAIAVSATVAVPIAISTATAVPIVS